MNRPFFNTDFSHIDLAVMANLMSFGSVQFKNNDAQDPTTAPPKTSQHSRVEVVYIGGCFKEAQNIKRWLDVNTGVLYHEPNCNCLSNSGFVAAGAQNARPVYVNNKGDKVRFMQQTTPGGTPVNTRIPVVYQYVQGSGTFFLDVDAGILYSGDGVTIQGEGYKLNTSGSFTGYNHHTVVPVQLPAQETKVNVTYVVGTTAFNSEDTATDHAKRMAVLNPGKEFTVDKVTTTKVVTKSKPYKVTETAQVKTVQTKSWE